MRIDRVAWADTVELRRTVLGWPTEPVNGDLDLAAVHLAIIDVDERPAGVVSAVAHDCPERPGVPAVYFWGMAVAEPHRARGYGRRLLGAVEEHARSMGAEIVWADARETAIGFYERCGARTVGEPYVDDVTGLIDRRVIRTLAEPSTID